MNSQNSYNSLVLFILFGAILTVLGGCAQPTSVPPSFALREQLQDIKQQQTAQQQQLQEMQQLLSRLQQQLASGQVLPATSDANQNATLSIRQNQEFATPASSPAIVIPQGGTADMLQVADSATSYLTAFSSLANGQYHAAETGFSQFLSTYPDHQYAPNARFWLANALAAQDKTSQAVSNLRQLIADPAGQEKAPAALVQLIQLYQKAGLTTQADDAVNQLRDNYANTPEARSFLPGYSGLN